MPTTLFQSSEIDQGHLLDGRVPGHLRVALHDLATTHLLTRPVEGEMLFLYLAISLDVVSSILTREEGMQKLVYYTSKLLKDAETHNLRMEITYALLISIW